MPKKATAKYTIQANTVFRNGEAVGDLKDNVITYRDGVKSPAVKKKIITMLSPLQALEIDKKPVAGVSEAVKAPEMVKADSDIGSATPPKGDAKMGDKDPIVMEWYKQNRPSQYAIKYKKFLAKQAEKELLESK